MIPAPLPCLAAVLCSVAFTASAPARLGETREQCAVRYGQAVAEVPALLESATGMAYQKGDIRIRIEFLDGKAAFISFSRRGLRAEERQTLLELNAGSLVWNPPGEFLGRMCWTAAGNAQEEARHASAYQAVETSYLDLASDAWAKAMKAQQAVQFAIKPRPATPAGPVAPGTPVPAAPAATGKLEGF